MKFPELYYLGGQSNRLQCISDFRLNVQVSFFSVPRRESGSTLVPAVLKYHNAVWSMNMISMFVNDILNQKEKFPSSYQSNFAVKAMFFFSFLFIILCFFFCSTKRDTVLQSLKVMTSNFFRIRFRLCFPIMPIKLYLH